MPILLGIFLHSVVCEVDKSIVDVGFPILAEHRLMLLSHLLRFAFFDAQLLLLWASLLLIVLGAIVEIILNAGKSGIALLKEVRLEMFFPVCLGDLYKNPETHIKLEPIEQERTTYVLLDNVALRFHVFVVHLNADLERTLAQQLRELFQSRKHMDTPAPVQRSRL